MYVGTQQNLLSHTYSKDLYWINGTRLAPGLTAEDRERMPGNRYHG